MLGLSEEVVAIVVEKEFEYSRTVKLHMAWVSTCGR